MAAAAAGERFACEGWLALHRDEVSEYSETTVDDKCMQTMKEENVLVHSHHAVLVLGTIFTEITEILFSPKHGTWFETERFSLGGNAGSPGVEA